MDHWPHQHIIWQLVELGVEPVGLGAGAAGRDLLFEVADDGVLDDDLVLQVLDVAAVLLLLAAVLGLQLLVLLLVVELQQFVELARLLQHRLGRVLRVLVLAGSVGPPLRHHHARLGQRSHQRRGPDVALAEATVIQERQVAAPGLQPQVRRRVRVLGQERRARPGACLFESVQVHTHSRNIIYIGQIPKKNHC